MTDDKLRAELVNAVALMQDRGYRFKGTDGLTDIPPNMVADDICAALAASATDERTIGRPGEYVGWAGPDRTANDAASATDEGPRDPDQNVWDAIGDPEQPLTRVHEKQAPVVLSRVGGVELVAVSVDRAGLVRWEERPTRVADDALIAELASDLCPDKEPCKGHRIRAREYLTARPAVPALDERHYAFQMWDGRVLVVTVDDEDPGDMGEPRSVSDHDANTEYVSVRAKQPEYAALSGKRP